LVAVVDGGRGSKNHNWRLKGGRVEGLTLGGGGGDKEAKCVLRSDYAQKGTAAQHFSLNE
jgi:hypothetical protein